MARPTIQIGDEVREMTVAEFEQWKIDANDAQNAVNAVAVRAAALQSARTKLAALGLTPEEIAAFLG